MSGKIGNTNASKRRQLAQDAARLKIKAGYCIDQLIAIDKALATAKKDSVPALKARADIQFGLLKKVVPDIRHVEHSGHVEQTIEHRGVLEARERLAQLLGERAAREEAAILPH